MSGLTLRLFVVRTSGARELIADSSLLNGPRYNGYPLEGKEFSAPIPHTLRIGNQDDGRS